MSEVSKFVLTRGVLGWGVTIILITTGWDLFLNPRSNLRATSHFTSRLLYNVLVCFFLGGLFGLVAWRVRRNRRKNPKPSVG